LKYREINKSSVIEALSTRRIHPHIPEMMVDIINITGSSSASTNDLIKVIEKDKDLAERIIHIANSGSFSLKRIVKTLPEAVVILGWNSVKMVSLGSTILKCMSEKDHRLYRHSIMTSKVARFLAIEAGFYKVEEISIVGFLHDFGITIMQEFFNPEFLRAKQYALDHELPIHIAEREILGVDHADVGGWTLETWNLPENITESVALHHSFDPKKYHAKKTGVIHMADTLALAADFRGPSWEKISELSPDVFSVLGFSQNDLRDFIMAIMKMKYREIF